MHEAITTTKITKYPSHAKISLWLFPPSIRTPHLLSVTIDDFFLDCYIMEPYACVHFLVCLLSLNVVGVRSIHVVSVVHSLLGLNSIPQYRYTTVS